MVNHLYITMVKIIVLIIIAAKTATSEMIKQLAMCKSENDLCRLENRSTTIWEHKSVFLEKQPKHL